MDRFVYQLNGNKMQDITRKDTESSFIKVFLYLLIQLEAYDYEIQQSTIETGKFKILQEKKYFSVAFRYTKI